MPELPEVETVRLGLLPAMQGHRITDAEVRRPDLRWPFPERFQERLLDREVVRLDRRGKYLLIELEKNEVLIAHLGMSGRFQVDSLELGQFIHPASQLDKHEHIVLWMGSSARIGYIDARRFGAMDLVSTENITQHPWICDLGPEPLGNEFSEAYLSSCFLRRKQPMKAALMDQHLVAGLGNIYVNETLHRSQISPLMPANALSQEKIGALHRAIIDVLAEAISAGGSSLKDHRQADGQLGYFQHRFQAYGQAGKKCQHAGCSGEIIQIKQSGRATFFCSVCQAWNS